MTPTDPAIRILATVLLIVLVHAPADAQAPPPLERELRVFFDCPEFYCDDDFLIEQIAWVDFVRDRAVADVHVLVTRQPTAGGGQEHSLRFIGRDRFAGRELTLTYVSGASATDDDVRRGLARVARLGLAGFAAETAAAPRLDVAFAEPEAGATQAATEDPWNRWVFDFGVDSWFDGEDQYRSMNLYGWAGASRVSDGWKHVVSLNGQNSATEFEIDDSTTVESGRESYGTNALSVRSITPHWSVGGFTGWSRSTHSNYDASFRVAPAIEYSLFPYGESTSRLATVLYAIGPRYFDYAERTIFGRTSETLLHHFLAFGYQATQPWGSADLTLEGEHYVMGLNGDTEWLEPQYSVSLGGGVQVRVVRGLSVRLNGWSELVRDQIQLPAGDLTEEEILTRQRELATGYRYWGSFGLTYQFGSIYSSVVNPRFDYLD